MHSGDKSHSEAMVQVLLSTNAAVEGVAGLDEQATGVAVAPVHAVPLDGVAGRNVQAQGAAIRTEHAGSFRGLTRGIVQSSSNRLVLDNYLSVDGVWRMLLDESVELRG